MMMRQQIAVRGVVQGVGFRPFVFNLAERLGLTGWVLNHSGGVDIEVEGAEASVHQFGIDLCAQAPPLARIESIEMQEAAPAGYTHFEIRRSEAQSGRYQLISPDIATCPDCLREVFDPKNRRYRYPFTNCTNCGPRFTIIADIPYDRSNTTMRVFPMCPDCQREYDDPRDRRFHAQPNACPVCGPRVQIANGNTEYAIRNAQHDPDVLVQTVNMLRQGQIVALKGLGGFQLACDAANADAVHTLRERKHRPHKPFALMMTTLNEVREHCAVSPEAEALLASPQAPIVLLPWRDDSSLARNVAPNQRTLGVMLPYTPLHHLLLHDFDGPLVMTSGNLSEEPIAADNDEAVERLGVLADAFLSHDRDIYARYDDSVWFLCQAEIGLDPQPVRRARGYAPFPIKLPFKGQQILAVGAEIKNTFCLVRDEYTFVSQHIGDMENLETLEHFQRTVDLYQHLFRIDPQVIACDLHPDYLSTRYARERVANYESQLATCSVQLVTVQHHHAHLAACLADNDWRPEQGMVIGVIMDGTGYGADGHIWGGEWLVGDYGGYRRAAHLQYLPLPGGDASTRQPWRIAFSYLHTLLGDVPSWAVPDEAQTALLRQQIDRRLNCPLTSSMGRLFDAVSALLGVCTETSYEAQAAIELEQIANCKSQSAKCKSAYPFGVEKVGESWQVRLGDLFVALVGEMQTGVPVGEIAAQFHRTVAEMIVGVCRQIAQEAGLGTVALSGGCFQNRLLLELTVPALREAGFTVLLHRQVPCNDGGLSLGQAVIAQHAVQNTQHVTRIRKI
ncbi:MAG: carbamoyltransferase HypF [Anaerolineae bacterium]|nr:carbamoyltransferase HypF [Anaerolineae bacterium]